METTSDIRCHLNNSPRHTVQVQGSDNHEMISISPNMMPQVENLAALETEARNPNTRDLNPLDTLGLCYAFHREEARVGPAIESCLSTIALFIEDLVPRLRTGGRLIYVGAGNSGRVGVMDCTELPVTFSVHPSQFLALVAGDTDSGLTGAVRAQEGAEDFGDDGFAAISALDLQPQDTVIGISASGRTPFVLGALQVAVAAKALTAGITNVQSSRIGELGLDYTITAPVGPEFLAGSTRLKAGTAAKTILNMISTCSMVRLGKTHQGLMVDVCLHNRKLYARGRRIVRQVCRGGPLFLLSKTGQLSLVAMTVPETEEGDEMLNELLQACDGDVKLACAVALSGFEPATARMRLDESEGVLSRFIESLHYSPVSRSFLSSPQIPALREYFLAIDGGGTNCTVSLGLRCGPDLIVGRGKTGPCSLHSVSLDDLLDRVKAATRQAYASLKNTRSTAHSAPAARNAFPKLTRVWAGFAGIDTVSDTHKNTLAHCLEEMFHVSLENDSLRLSSDGTLLHASLGLHNSAENAITVVAGTGSVAMALHKHPTTGEIRSLARTGGWGYMLGDEGSAFDLGKRALQVVLEQREERDDTEEPIPELEREIITRYHCRHTGQLLAGILQDSSMASKRRVADLAMIVTELAFRERDPDLQALSIVESSIRALVCRARPLVKQKYVPEPSRAVLVLSGSLMNLVGYRELFLEAWKLENLVPLGNIVVVGDPSTAAVEFLARIHPSVNEKIHVRPGL